MILGAMLAVAMLPAAGGGDLSRNREWLAMIESPAALTKPLPSRAFGRQISEL
jgi:hypothetical protein